MFDVDADLVVDDIAGQGPSAPRRRSNRMRFPPCQAGLEAYTGEIDDSIKHTHL